MVARSYAQHNGHGCGMISHQVGASAKATQSSSTKTLTIHNTQHSTLEVYTSGAVWIKAGPAWVYCVEEDWVRAGMTGGE